MTTISVYINRMLLGRVIVVLIGLMVVVISIDLLKNSDNVLRRSESVIEPLALYIYLRLPIIASQLISISSLVGSILVFDSLISHKELIMVWNAGSSYLRIARTVFPACLLLAFAQFVIDDRAVPPAQLFLDDWGLGAEDASNVGDENGFLWLVSNQDILRINKEAALSGTLKQITLFRRNQAGRITEILQADDPARGLTRRTIFAENRIVEAQESQSALVPLAERLTRDVLLNLANSLKNPKTVRFEDLVNLTSSEWISPGSRSFYQTWMYYRISNALSPFLLILLVLTLAHYSRARSTKYFLYWTSIALGFIYFIMQQICLALGEMGILPSLLAAGLPQILVLFFVLNAYLTIGQTSLPRRYQ
jgi:lipopolysaccharide export LptBFGC system permease protein LptF